MLQIVAKQVRDCKLRWQTWASSSEFSQRPGLRHTAACHLKRRCSWANISAMRSAKLRAS